MPTDFVHMYLVFPIQVIHQLQQLGRLQQLLSNQGLFVIRRTNVQLHQDQIVLVKFLLDPRPGIERVTRFDRHGRMNPMIGVVQMPRHASVHGLDRFVAVAGVVLQGGDGSGAARVLRRGLFLKGINVIEAKAKLFKQGHQLPHGAGKFPKAGTGAQIHQDDARRGLEGVTQPDKIVHEIGERQGVQVFRVAALVKTQVGMAERWEEGFDPTVRVVHVAQLALWKKGLL
mmetsp:Transcript_9728/g.21016  ORF Transcript_9728/g.21016 Transcript_9728/m.21016 type:complete len:229 (+) Transcript_9728:224-910(+)